MMSHTELNDLLTAYEIDVRFPDVSGMEHLDMLLTRSVLAEFERNRPLTVEQCARLAEADRTLAVQTVRFHSYYLPWRHEGSALCVDVQTVRFHSYYFQPGYLLSDYLLSYYFQFAICYFLILVPFAAGR